MARIAIIGAGMAALSALAVLRQHGHQVELFEKSRGTGGRLASKRGQQASWDMGAQYIKANSPEFARTLADWHQQGLVEPWAVTPWVLENGSARPSPDDQLRYAAPSRMTSLSRALAEPATALHTSTRITALQQAGQRWQVQSEQNEIFADFDAVIVTTPPAQAEPLVSSSTTLSSACQNAHMLPCWTLLLAFEQPLTTAFDAAFVKDGPIQWLARNSSKPGRAALETWVIMARHDWSHSCIDHTRPWVEQQLISAFWQLLGQDAVKPLESWLHRWLYALPQQPSGSGFALDHQQKLALCGDWLHSASVEGAWLSGQAAATALLGHLPSSTAQETPA